MAIEIAGITLERIHRLATLENPAFVHHRVPGLEGTLIQDTGRHSTRMFVEGIYYGEKAKEDLEKLRVIYTSRAESDFIAEIVDQTYFSQVVIERFEVMQHAGEPDQFSFRMILQEYIPPPQPVSDSGDLFDLDSVLEMDALDFMDMIKLPDLLSVPSFGDPTESLKGILANAGSSFDSLKSPSDDLSGIFGTGGDGRAAENPLSAQITNAGSPSVLEDLVKELMNGLLSGKDSTKSAADTSANGVDSVKRLVSGIKIPEFKNGDLLREGFDSVKSMLPTDLSQSVGGLDKEIDGLFSNLKTSLTTPLGSLLDNFKSFKQLGFLAGTDAPSGDPENTPSFKDASPPPDPAAQVKFITDWVNSFLALLPDPLTGETLVNLLYQQMKKLPRETLPVRVIPVYDELYDKLETALTWLQADANGLRDHLVQTLNALEGFIRKMIITDVIDPVRENIENSSSKLVSADLKTHIDAIISGLNQLGEIINNVGSLDGCTESITDLGLHISMLKANAGILKTELVQQKLVTLNEQLVKFGSTLEKQMTDILLVGLPSSDLSLISLSVEPLNQVLESTGIPTFISGIHEAGNSVGSLLDLLNVQGVSQTASSAIDDATKAIKGFSDAIVKVSADISMIINRIGKAIDDLGVASLVEELKKTLERFEKDVVSSLNTIFDPIKNALKEAFDALDKLVKEIDPKKITDEFTSVLGAIGGILGNKDLQNTITTIKKALQDVNAALSQLSFNSETDEVIKAIGVVSDAVGVIAKLPLPDSVKNDVRKLLPPDGLLPSAEDLKKITDSLEKDLKDMIENGPKPVLLEVAGKPAELADMIKQYSPEKLIGDKLTGPYNDFLTGLEGLSPAKLMEPVKKEMDTLTGEISKTLDPSQLFNVLKDPYHTLHDALDKIDPKGLTDQLQAKLTEGITAVTDVIPLHDLDGVVSIINAIVDKINGILESAKIIRGAFDAVDTRFSGLKDTEKQIKDWGTQVAGKFGSLSDVAPMATAFNSIEAAIHDIQGNSLQTMIFQPLDGLAGTLSDLDPRNRLVSLTQAKNNFPVSKLNLMSVSTEKTSLQNILSAFDPMDQLFAGTLGALQDLTGNISKYKTDLTGFFTTWQSLYFKPDGPLSKYYIKNPTFEGIKIVISKTLDDQLTNAIAPVFKIIGYLQSFVASLLEEISALIKKFETQTGSLMQVVKSLTDLFAAVKGVVDQLDNLDITFIAREIEKVFGDVKTQLEAFDPEKLGKIFTDIFNGLLSSIDLDKLLGLPDLDADFKNILDLLKKINPGKIVTEALKPLYDEILNFLKELDFKDSIESLISNFENLEKQLGDDLGKVIDAYGGLLKEFDSSLGS